MRTVSLHAQRLKGFTLIELLVVVAIIALLISILLPSLGNAKKQAQGAVCASNLQQIMLAMTMYEDEHNGWLPQSAPSSDAGTLGSIWSEGAWWVHKRDLWFYRLVPKYLQSPKAYVCPGDPFIGQFDFEERDDPMKFACGYGMNYIMRHYDPGGDNQCRCPQPYEDYMLHTTRWGPKRPFETILLAEVGPDEDLMPTPLMASLDGNLGLAWRDGGRLIWDDGKRGGWDAGGTWLTGRHAGHINMATYGGSVRKVNTVKQLKNKIERKYVNHPVFGDCRGLIIGSPPKFVCPFCYWSGGGVAHYTFAEQKLWWWTGNPCPKRRF